MFKNAMSSANQGTRNFSLCLHIRKISRALIHRANAREPVKPQASRAALRLHGLHCGFTDCTAASRAALRLHGLHCGFTGCTAASRLHYGFTAATPISKQEGKV
jgi:hypothetical protein